MSQLYDDGDALFEAGSSGHKSVQNSLQQAAEEVLPFQKEDVLQWNANEGAFAEMKYLSILDQSLHVNVSSEDPTMAAYKDNRYHRILTEDDGACAIHACFGTPPVSSGSKLFCVDARLRALATFGDSATIFLRRLKSQALYDSITSCIWNDYLLPILREQCGLTLTKPITTQGKILWNVLAEHGNLQSSWIEHVRLEVQRQDCSDEMLDFEIIAQALNNVAFVAHKLDCMSFRFLRQNFKWVSAFNKKHCDNIKKA